MTKEECVRCYEYTGRAGKYDDSLYTPDGQGPFCEECYSEIMISGAAFMNGYDGEELP